MMDKLSCNVSEPDKLILKFIKKNSQNFEKEQWEGLVLIDVI